MDSRDAVNGSLSWVGDNADSMRQDTQPLVKELRKAAITAGKLEKAAMRKMCVGVFGVSQAGKSYLISALARAENKPLMAMFDDAAVDFLAEINPEGGGESTGLVTRFTIDRPVGQPSGYPVMVRLLSEMDIVKILVNSYVFDVSHDEEDDDFHDPKAIFGALEKLEKKMAGQPLGHVIEEDIYDLEDYCNHRLIANPRIKKLRKIHFWDHVATIAPRLEPRDREELFALLWDGFTVYSVMYKRLQQALNRLNAADVVYCSLDGLFKSDDGRLKRRPSSSIINVSTLRALDDESGSADTVKVSDASGRVVDIARSDLTALIAELNIVMKDRPFEFFEHTDLLDFPGARTRAPVMMKREADGSGKRSELLLRGKVAYLFERYSSDQELTSLLLCCGPENNEVEGIDSLVAEWISATHGDTPEERDGQENALFCVLTKFDRSFELSVGKDNPFPNRIHTSLIEPYCKRYDWPTQWNSAGSFQNCYAVRNPTIRQEGLFDYVGADPGDPETFYKEKEVRADKVEVIKGLRTNFLNADEVKHHFVDPDRAWEAVMELNDGGIAYLVAKLEPLCNPDLKSRQVQGRLDRLLEQVISRLKPFHVSGDADAELRKKQAMTQKIWKALAPSIGNRRFVEFLETLQITEADIYDVHFAAKNRPIAPILATEAESTVDEAVAADNMNQDAMDILNELGAMFDAPDTSSQSEPAPSTMASAVERPAYGFPECFAQSVEEHWAQQMRGLSADPRLSRYFSVQPEILSELVEELILGARRAGIFHELSDLVTEFEQFKEDVRIWKQVTPACRLVNDFLIYMGYGGRWSRTGQSIEKDGKVVRHLFKPREPVGTYPRLEVRSPAFDKDFYLDWLSAFGKLVEENVAYQAGIMDNLEQNTRLGSILERLGSSVG